MADKTLNIRIKSKYDTLANWTANKSKVLLTFAALKGNTR